MKKARYIRQSTAQQSNLRQLAKAHPDEILFIDTISGSIPFAERPAGKKLTESIEREGQLSMFYRHLNFSLIWV
jgi:DNA invertase Pin-like site-specific DNA recombinase